MHYIVDCDTGIDDTLALVTLLELLKGDPGSDLLGVTASYGNVTMEQGLRNSLAVLHLFGADDVPVYPGVEHALGMRSFEVAPGVELVHGRNGLGGQEIPDSPRKAESMPASVFMARAAKKYGKDLTIIATGAFTNLADALRARPQMAREIGGIVMMGTSVSVPGSINAWTEANVGADPEAASQVLASGADLLIVGRDVTSTTILTQAQARRWALAGTDRGRFLSAIMDWYMRSFATRFPGPGACSISDPTAVVLALHPGLITLELDRHLMVDLDGPTRGRTIVDTAFAPDPDPRTRIVLRLDNSKFMDILLGAVSGAVAASD